ncbi:MAG: hypothetical protein ABEN55_17950 [Bradymonadaceae bacterium]
MLSIAPVDTDAGRRAMAAPGGFVWWYVDAVDADGNGCVIIWSYGLPFLPGYASAERKGEASEAAERPSLNVAVYRGGQLDCYLLREYSPEETVWRPEEGYWRFGETEMQSRRREGRRRVSVALDCPIPGGDRRLRGTVEIAGPAPAIAGGTRMPNHRWSPRIVIGETGVDLRAGGTERYRSSGRGYHDANCGVTPFHRLGIERWLWGRCPLPDRELVFYGLWPAGDGAPQHRVLTFDADGDWHSERAVEFQLEGARRNIGGMRWWNTLRVTGPAAASWSPLEVEVRDVVDSGPFYMRYLTRSASATGVAELIRPGRIDLARHRPFVQMRVQRSGESNSAWLPLFSGPRRGRFRRLLDYNFGGGAG